MEGRPTVGAILANRWLYTECDLCELASAPT
jgi:hypothetical protein